MGRPKKFTREAVLEKALPVFWRHGFADASLHELEQATGVNKSGLYAEFKDKEILDTFELHTPNIHLPWEPLSDSGSKARPVNALPNGSLHCAIPICDTSISRSSRRPQLYRSA